MNRDRWREFIRLFDRLNVVGLQRAHTPLERWYEIDRLIWIIAVVESVGETEARETYWLSTADDS
jgi:hypothetical protein